LHFVEKASSSPLSWYSTALYPLGQPWLQGRGRELLDAQCAMAISWGVSAPRGGSQATTFFDAAIHGQKVSPALVGSVACLSNVFLLQRIFFGLVASLQALARPSGFVPGLGRSGRGWRLLIAGGIQGLDHVFAIYFRMLCVNVQDLVVIFFFILVLPVKFH
jgi:hypothetical protein